MEKQKTLPEKNNNLNIVYNYTGNTEYINIKEKENSILLSSLLSTSSSSYSNYPSSFIYSTNNNTTNNNTENTVYNSVTEDLGTNNDETIYAQFALFFENINKIYIPKKVKFNLERYVSKKLLKEIDVNIEVAIEKCLIFLSQLSTTYYNEEKWKPLSSEILHSITKKKGDNTYVYTKIIKYV